MSREKSEKDVRNVPITVRLNEEEHEKLKQLKIFFRIAAENNSPTTI